MKAKVLEIRPTQFALGMAEVSFKVSKIRKMKHQELDDYLESHRVPVVHSPDGHKYMIDHHHLVRACWEAGIEEVKVLEKADLSHLEGHHFWAEMKKLEWDRSAFSSTFTSSIPAS